MKTVIQYLSERVFEPSMVLQNLVTTVCVMLVLRTPEQQKPLQKLCRFAVLLLELVLLNALWEAAFSSPGSYYLTHALLLLSLAFWQRRIKSVGCAVTIINFYAVEISTISLSSVFPELLLDFTHGSQWEIVLRNATVLLTLPIALLFRKFSLLDFRLEARDICYSALTGGAALVMSVLYFLQRSSYNVYGNAFAGTAFVSVLIISMVAQYLTYANCLSREHEKQLVIENYSAQNYRRMLRLNEQNQEDMRKVRHDIKNHFACIGALLHDRKYAEATSYFDSLTETVMVPLEHIDCGNHCLNAVLNLEAAKSRTYGVKLDHRVFAAPELPIEDNDLCAILTNLIDNAIEASARLHTQDAVVEAGINQRDDFLYLCVVNPVPPRMSEKELLSLKTTKTDRDMHGYGHKIVDGLVEKYDGMLSRSIHNGKYTVDVVLNLPQKK